MHYTESYTPADAHVPTSLQFNVAIISQDENHLWNKNAYRNIPGQIQHLNGKP
jgi:hypothetical protein